MKKLDLRQMENVQAGGCADEFAGVATAATILALATGGIGLVGLAAFAGWAALACHKNYW